MANPPPNIDVWQSKRVGGLVFYHGSGVTHPYPLHWHEELHLCLYTANFGYLGYQGNSQLVAAGDTVVTPPGEVHENWVTSETGISFYSVYLPAAFLADLASQIAGQASEREFPLMHVRDAEIAQAFLRAYAAEKSAGSRLECEAAWFQLFHLLLARTGMDPQSGTTERKDIAMLSRVRRYIEENFAEPISLADLSKLTDLSAFHIHRLFSRDAGMPPHAYQNQVRVNRAKQLLRSGESLSEIAAATGFADQSHLTRHFRRLVGLPPGRYSAEFRTRTARTF
jgi:AraC-like DNA-binding protein